MTGQDFILFVDDDTVATRRMIADLAEATGYGLQMAKPREVDNIGSALDNPNLRLVLVDRVVQRGGSTLPILEDVVEGRTRTPPIPTYIISGRDIDPSEREELLEKWRKSLASTLDVRGTLQKPLSPPTLVGLVGESRERSEASRLQTSDAVDEIVESFKLPARLLDREGRLRTCNLYWNWDVNFPEPNNQDDGRDFYVPSSSQTSVREHDSFPRLSGYRLQNASTSDGRTLQVAISLDVASVESTVDGYLDNMWLLLRTMGFSRMRYYRKWDIPGTAGVLCLERVRGEPKISNETFPGFETWGAEMGAGSELCFPIGPQLAQTYERYRFKERPEKFFFKIARSREGPPVREASALKHINEIVGLAPDEPWLEIPVLWRVGDGADVEYQTCAFVVADRKGLPNVGISDEEINRRAISLRTHCVALAGLLEREAERIDRDARIDVRKFLVESSIHLDRAATFDGLIRAMTAKAQELSGAEVATICWRPRHSAESFVQAVVVKQDAENAFPDASKLEGRGVDIKALPVLFTTLTERKPTFWQDGVPEDLDQKFSEVSSKSLDARWPRVALPLKVGDRIVGAIGLIHRNRRRFTKQKVEAVNHLIELCAVMLDYVGAEASRDSEMALMHEVRTLALRALKSVALASEPGEVSKARWYLEMLLDRSRSYSRLNHPGVIGRRKTVNPTACLERELSVTREIATDYDKRIEVRSPGASGVNIEAEPGCLSFVIRTLLENALHHGTGSPVEVQEFIEGARWVLRVINPGAMTIMEDRLKFEPFIVVPRRRKDGSHMGLATARRWVEVFDAELTLENEIHDAQKVVVATLRWPIKVDGGGDRNGRTS